MKISEKFKVIKSAVAAIEKQFGKGSIMILGESSDNIHQIDTVSSGSLSLDIALGIGGLPRGRLVEVYGQESSGKTTLALQAIAQVQKENGIAAFIDAEHAMDLKYAKALGVDTKNLLLSQPDHGEQALEICEMLVRSGAIDIVVVDSVAALVPKAEIEGDMGDSHMGLQARLMSQAMRKLTGICSKQGTILLFINQTRQKIGIVFGNPETTTGGNALKFYSSIRMQIKRIGAIKDKDELKGNRTRVKVVKNKLASPFKEVEFDVLYGKGICKFGEILDLAVEHQIVNKNGSWYVFEDKQLGQGRERVKESFMNQPDLFDTIVNKIMDKVGLKEQLNPDEIAKKAA